MFGAHHNIGSFLQTELGKRGIKVQVTEEQDESPTHLTDDLLEEKYADPDLRHSDEQLLRAMLHEQLFYQISHETTKRHLAREPHLDGREALGIPSKIYEGIDKDPTHRHLIEATKEKILAMPMEQVRALLTDRLAQEALLLQARPADRSITAGRGVAAFLSKWIARLFGGEKR